MLISLISFLLVFSLIVLVHEMGHFLAARSVGVRIYEFSIGFPFSPKILTLFRNRETEFTLRLLPLGGFVSFSKDKEEVAGDLFGAPYLNRALIMSAGSLFNIIFAFLIFVPVLIAGKHIPFAEAVWISAKTVWAVLSGTITVIFNLFSGHASTEGLLGPVGIAAVAGKAASKGLLSLVYFTGLLSMSLGVMNLIPLPALDGGQLFMLLIESVRRRPLSLETYQMVNMVGLTLFLILTVIVTYRDVVKLVA